MKNNSQVIFEKAWELNLKKKEPALYADSIQKISFFDLKGAIEKEDEAFINNFVEDYYNGVVFIFENAFDPTTLKRVKETMKSKCKQLQASGNVFDKENNLIEKYEKRDWHIENEGYGYCSAYDLIHTYREKKTQNSFLFDFFKDTYLLLKTINGIKPNSEFKTTDRIEVNHYPVGVGGIGFHNDPIAAVRFTLTTNLNSFGEDYFSGGFAVGKRDGSILKVDPEIKLGSLVGFMPTVCHGVEIIDLGKKEDWDLSRGRWYAQITTVVDEQIKNRPVTLPNKKFPTLYQQIRGKK